MWSKGICWDRASDSPTKRPLLFCHPATLLYFPWEFGGQLDIGDGPTIYLQAHIIKRCRINDVTSPLYFYINVSRLCYINVIFSCRCTFWGKLKQSTISNLVAYWLESPEEIVGKSPILVQTSPCD